MSNYINETKIQTIASKCEELFTVENKNTINKLSKKHGLEFTSNTASNANMLWKLSKEKLINDSRRVLSNGKTVQDSITGQEEYNGCLLGYNIQDFNLHITEYIQDYIADNYQKDYDFLCEFDVLPLFELIEKTYIVDTSTHLTDIPTFAELLEVNDYFKYFTNRYGVGSVDPSEVEITKRITTFFDTMFSGVKNRDYILKDISAYLISGDVPELHTKLFKDFNQF